MLESLTRKMVRRGLIAVVPIALLVAYAAVPDAIATGPLDHGAAGVPASSDVLALLPEGPEKRKFLMDCTGCHPLDAERAFPNGIPRSEADWRDVVARMLPMGGAGGPSLLISPARDPASTARWLAEHLDAPPESARRPPTHPMPYGLRVAPDGRVWGTELRGGRLFSYDPDSGATSVHEMPDVHSGPRRPAVDADGGLWIPEFAGNRLTHFDPATGEFRSFEFPIASVLPYVAEVDRQTGLVWVGTAAADLVFSFDPSTETFTAYPMPTAAALIRHLVVDEARGEIWAAYGAFPGIAPGSCASGRGDRPFRPSSVWIA